MMVIGTHLFAQDLEGVYFKKVPKHIFFFKLRPRVIPSHYIYVYLKKDSSMVYINTIGGLGRTTEVLHDKYVMKGDSIFFDKNIDAGILTNDGLCIPFWGCELKKTKLSDIERFIKKYEAELKERKNICFQNGYAIPCNTSPPYLRGK